MIKAYKGLEVEKKSLEEIVVAWKKEEGGNGEEEKTEGEQPSTVSDRLLILCAPSSSSSFPLTESRSSCQIDDRFSQDGLRLSNEGENQKGICTTSR